MLIITIKELLGEIKESLREFYRKGLVGIINCQNKSTGKIINTQQYYRKVKYKIYRCICNGIKKFAR